MKLRRNLLKPIELDLSGAVNRTEGISQNDLHRKASELNDRLKIYLETAGPEQLELFTRPEQLLRAYWKDRTHTELALTFKLANQLHQSVDRVVIFGIDDSHIVAKSLLEACCPPYWNELSRGERGSKPRMYFDGNHLDNDLTQGLLYLLGNHSGKPIAASDHPELQQWAIVVIDSNVVESPSSEINARHIARGTYKHFYDALKKQCLLQDGNLDRLSRQLIPLWHAESAMKTDPVFEQSLHSFSIPDSHRGLQIPFTSAALLPAAIVGINVIEYLQGAYSMYQHFIETEPEKNIVLQFLALQSLLEQRSHSLHTHWNFWNTGLQSCSNWLSQFLLHQQSIETRGDQRPDATFADTKREQSVTHSCTVPTTRSWESSFRQYHPSQCLIHNVTVGVQRFDAISLSESNTNPQNSPESEGETRTIPAKPQSPHLPELVETAYSQMSVDCLQSHYSITRLHLHRLDELHLGQLYQFFMLVSHFRNVLI